jgi:hypothetical protein
MLIPEEGVTTPLARSQTKEQLAGSTTLRDAWYKWRKEYEVLQFYSTSIITVLYLLDLYNVCAEVREEHGSSWARKDTGQVKNSDSPQGRLYSFAMARTGGQGRKEIEMR